MGFALELQSFFVTAPGAAGAVAAAVPGDSLFIRNGRAGTDILTLGCWTRSQSAGFTQVISTSQHDAVRGLRYRHSGTAPENRIPVAFPLHHKPQDALTITQAGSAAAGDIELVHMLNWYEDLPGVEGNFINPAMLRARGLNLLTIEDTLTPTVAATYSGQRAFTAASDLFKADTEYAILGATSHPAAGACGAIAFQGVDFGNLRVGLPANPLKNEIGNNFFLSLAEMYDIPCIPVFNSANRNAVFATLVQDENLIASPIAIFLVQLAPRPAAPGPALTQPNA